MDCHQEDDFRQEEQREFARYYHLNQGRRVSQAANSKQQIRKLQIRNLQIRNLQIRNLQCRQLTLDRSYQGNM